MPGRRTTRRLRWALLLVGVGVVALVGFTGYQATKAKVALESLAGEFNVLTDRLKDGDTDAARASLGRAQQYAATAHQNTSGPGWWLTTQFPGVGDDVEAVRTVADVADVLAHRVLPPVIDASEILDPARLRPVDGHVDLAPISRVAPAVVAADRALQRQVARVAAIDTGSLTSQLAAPVALLQDKLAQAGELSDRASRAVRLLPPMLGQDGPRTYLLLFQNNAEIRTTGGIPGSFALVTADRGDVEMRSQGDAATIGRFDRPVLPLTAEERQLFDEQLAVFPQDVNLTPHFPRSAQLVSEMWTRTVGDRLDGVLSTDPVALSYLLRGTGPVPLPAGVPAAEKLSADNAVRLLLSDIYAAQPDPRLQNAYFDGVARAVFDAVSSGRGQPRAVLEGLSRAASERRILAWSAHPEEQRILAPTALSGAVPTRATATPRVGVYFNGATASKLDYYLHYEARLKAISCAGDRQRLRLTLTMRSAVPADAAALPDYMRGLALPDAPVGTLRTTVLLYAPVGGEVTEVSIDGTTDVAADYAHMGRDVAALTADLEPGQRNRITVELLSGPGQTAHPRLRVTPGANGPGVGRVGGSACS